jgi:hypothetical protein
MGKLNEGFCRGFNEIVLVKSNKNPNSIKNKMIIYFTVFLMGIPIKSYNFALDKIF